MHKRIEQVPKKKKDARVKLVNEYIVSVREHMKNLSQLGVKFVVKGNTFGGFEFEGKSYMLDLPVASNKNKLMKESDLAEGERSTLFIYKS
jgi:hypothetical protein